MGSRIGGWSGASAAQSVAVSNWQQRQQGVSALNSALTAGTSKQLNRPTLDWWAIVLLASTVHWDRLARLCRAATWRQRKRLRRRFKTVAVGKIRRVTPQVRQLHPYATRVAVRSAWWCSN